MMDNQEQSESVFNGSSDREDIYMSTLHEVRIGNYGCHRMPRPGKT